MGSSSSRHPDEKSEASRTIFNPQLRGREVLTKMICFYTFAHAYGRILVRQKSLFKSEGSAYGGTLLNTRKGRSKGRPLAVKSTMHLVLRSSLAVGKQSFRYGKNPQLIKEVIGKFSDKYSVKILSLANVGNHIHIHLQLTYREGYIPFIRAVTAALAMAITGLSRWNPGKGIRFWDRRPFTRIVMGFKDRLRLQDYIEVNQLEGLGNSRADARIIIEEWKEDQTLGPPLLA